MIIIFISLNSVCAKEVKHQKFSVEVLAENQGIIWSMVFIDPDNILFAEKKGQFKILNIRSKKIHIVAGSPQVYDRGQGGLMDIALHPEFIKNKKIYFTYSKEIGNKQTTALAQGILSSLPQNSNSQSSNFQNQDSQNSNSQSPNSRNQDSQNSNSQSPNSHNQDSQNPSSQSSNSHNQAPQNSNKKTYKISQAVDIFLAQPALSSGLHFGSRLAFDNQGFLFMTMGDRGERHKAQELNTHLGKVLKLTQAGKPAPGNPFYTAKPLTAKLLNTNNSSFKADAKQALPEIWSFGHRNPQGIYIHPMTGRLWEQEHGPKGGDEINLIKKGANYGWPIITYGREYWGPRIGEGFVKKGLEQPVKYYTPSIAPSSLLIYSGKKFKEWKGDFFSGALVLKHLNRLKISQNNIVKEEERLLSSLDLRVRDVIEDQEGFIYVSSDEGKILRLNFLTENGKN